MHVRVHAYVCGACMCVVFACTCAFARELGFLHANVCVCMLTCACVCACVFVCMRVRVRVCACARACLWLYACMGACMCVRICVCAEVRTCMRVRVRQRTRTCVLRVYRCTGVRARMFAYVGACRGCVHENVCLPFLFLHHLRPGNL